MNDQPAVPEPAPETPSAPRPEPAAEPPFGPRPEPAPEPPFGPAAGPAPWAAPDQAWATPGAVPGSSAGQGPAFAPGPGVAAGPGGPAASPGLSPGAMPFQPDGGVRHEGLATASLVFGLIGWVVLSVGLAIAALVRIRRDGTRGRGRAIGGLVLSSAWTLLILLVAFVIMPGVRDGIEQANAGGSSGDPSAGKGSGISLFPQPGECFNAGPGDSGAVAEVPCDRPHDAQMILTFVLPSGRWPGNEEVERLGTQGWEDRLETWLKRRPYISGWTVYALLPTRLSWWAHDRRVHCAITLDQGRLTGPIDMAPPPADVREWPELRAEDCIEFPQGRSVTTVRLVGCDTPHTGQVTHTFTLVPGPWPGRNEADKQAQRGCGRRWAALFGAHPASVPVQEWYVSPAEATWEAGDRSVVCYVTAKKGRLTRNVL